MFAASIEELECGTPVVSVSGEVDIDTARTLEQTLFDVAENRTGEVIVDLTNCSFVDAKGVRALVTTRARLDRSGRPLALVLSNANVVKVLELTHFDELFEIYPSLAAAVGTDGTR
jgi:anti-anti-sigma factor